MLDSKGAFFSLSSFPGSDLGPFWLTVLSPATTSPRVPLPCNHQLFSELMFSFVKYHISGITQGQVPSAEMTHLRVAMLLVHPESELFVDEN